MKTFFVDAFTNEPFKGNPAGVCFPERPLDGAEMLHIAKEFGLSETAFVMPAENEDTFVIRYFSPKKEIPLCGHATLASAKVLFETSDHPSLKFITIKHEILSVTKRDNEIIMEFPVYDTVPIQVPASTLRALGVDNVVNKAFSEQNKIILLEIESASILGSLSPNFAELVSSYDNINGVLVTAPSKNDDYDYHYRYFWPWAGSNEDPVTGGVQTFLGKYWSQRLDKKVMRAFQSSARTGYMEVELRGEKVLLTSQAVILLEGNFIGLTDNQKKH